MEHEETNLTKFISAIILVVIIAMLLYFLQIAWYILAIIAIVFWPICSILILHSEQVFDTWLGESFNEINFYFIAIFFPILAFVGAIANNLFI